MSGYGKKAGRTWVYSDPHFYHHNICKFTKEDGSKLRPWDDAEKMTEDMINWYNEMVHPEDRVYILGDVAFNAGNMEKSVGRMNGRKVLVPGNHDPVKMRKYFDLFDDVIGAWGGDLERILTIGGDNEASGGKQKTANRFKPVVKYLGPFHLKRGQTQKQSKT